MDWIVTCCRSYYRCTFQKNKGWLATKKVQRSEEEHNFAKKVLLHKHTAKGSWSVKQWIHSEKQWIHQHFQFVLTQNKNIKIEILEQWIPVWGLDRGRTNKAKRTWEWEGLRLQQRHQRHEVSEWLKQRKYEQQLRWGCKISPLAYVCRLNWSENSNDVGGVDMTVWAHSGGATTSERRRQQATAAWEVHIVTAKHEWESASIPLVKSNGKILNFWHT